MKARRRLRKFVKFATGGLHRLRYLLHWMLGKYSAKHIRLDGNMDLLGRNICILSIFCHEKRIPRSTLALTRAIKRAGYDLIVVLNGAHRAREEFQNGLGSRDIVITRPNLGRDFAAYQLVTNLLLAKKGPSTASFIAMTVYFIWTETMPTTFFGVSYPLAIHGSASRKTIPVIMYRAGAFSCPHTR